MASEFERANASKSSFDRILLMQQVIGKYFIDCIVFYDNSPLQVIGNNSMGI